MPTPLWAPWRMEYLLAMGKAEGCFLCDHPKDVESFRKELVVVVQEHAFVCLNRYPFTTSHLLVSPRRHVDDPSALSDEEYMALMTLLRESIVRLRRAVNCHGVNVGFNIGKAAGAGVADHLHGHIVPRWDGDTNFLPVLTDVRVMSEYLDESWKRLYEAFSDMPGIRAPAEAAR